MRLAIAGSSSVGGTFVLRARLAHRTAPRGPAAASKRRPGHGERNGIDALEQGARLRAQVTLQSERPVHAGPPSEIEQRAIRGDGFVSQRPWIAVCNQPESQAQTAAPGAIEKRAAELLASALAPCASLEAQMADLPPKDRAALRAERERAGAALTRAVRERARIIPLVGVGEGEYRAGKIARGRLARGTAGRIHADIERGFIRAELISRAEFAPLRGDLAGAKRFRKMRLEGKDCEVQVGDMGHFRFNV